MRCEQEGVKGDTDYRPMPPFCSPDIRRYRAQAKNTPRLIHTVLLHASRDGGGITLQHVATQMQSVKGVDFLLQRDEKPFLSHDRRFERGSELLMERN